jgi:aryl-alcohol dehydrogenase-like predicted oxidoreductase
MADSARDARSATVPDDPCSMNNSKTVQLADDLNLTRMGYGAIQLAGPMAWGPPKDRDQAVAVLHEVVALGITHIDTSDYYGPYTVNELIRETLHPYPANLRIVTKVGARRGPDKSWPAAISRDDLIKAVHDNLEHLELSTLDLVNLRMTDTTAAADIIDPFTVLAELQQEGLIKHLGVSNVSTEQVLVARQIAPVRSVQNFYNLAMRKDDALVDFCAQEGIAFVPFFPLGGFRPLQSDALQEVADELGHSPLQVAQAWLLQRSPSMLLIPGTSSVEHLRENVAAADIELPATAVDKLNSVGTAEAAAPWARH